jgi:prepilin-type N-terminal cleavage/methylation domain-containing protein
MHARTRVEHCRVPQRGFTLVELVVVIVILGVLAAFAIPRFVNLNGYAEQSAVGNFVGALKSARSLAFTSSRLYDGTGYTAPSQISLYNLVRCDQVTTLDPLVNGWQGHYIALGSIRPNLFRDPDESACSGNQIQFHSKTGRTITITGGVDITWAASPSY